MQFKTSAQCRERRVVHWISLEEHSVYVTGEVSMIKINASNNIWWPVRRYLTNNASLHDI